MEQIGKSTHHFKILQVIALTAVSKIIINKKLNTQIKTSHRSPTSK